MESPSGKKAQYVDAGAKVPSFELFLNCFLAIFLMQFIPTPGYSVSSAIKRRYQQYPHLSVVRI